MDLDTEDIIMHDQYQTWLKDLEHYYSLPVTEEMTWKRLTNNTRVFAKWIDPTDPELHGSWMSGKVHSSRAWEGRSPGHGEGDENQWRHSYHIYFDNGDQDENLQDIDVLEEEVYMRLLSEKMERGREKSHLSGLDLITEASKISSPVKMGPNGGSAEMKLCSEDNAPDDDLMVDDLRCNEVLETRAPDPSHVARLTSSPSPDVHYGIYMKEKPWQVSFSLKNDGSSVPQDQLKSADPTSGDKVDAKENGNSMDVDTPNKKKDTADLLSNEEGPSSDTNPTEHVSTNDSKLLAASTVLSVAQKLTNSNSQPDAAMASTAPVDSTDPNAGQSITDSTGNENAVRVDQDAVRVDQAADATNQTGTDNSLDKQNVVQETNATDEMQIG